ncbi:MAG: glutamate-1-semialdehyde-2,1-aminomutase [Candidatus Melainabacteria bacterium RIFCSPHIGHO2_02_FULL_34_12]|nr:MAG: glutamate-1-semialdehyde-2,1-aminomutase [Candidatus Melainabacteria bacterium RIFCSPHIGHO2_02_FULL_34_12]
MLETLPNTKKSQELFKRACELIPGGVNSPVRAFKSVGLDPLFISKAKGSYIWDADQNKYIDFVNSWGALIHGHLPPEVVDAIEKALLKGISFGACHENEIELAEIVTKNFPSIEKVRFVNSGTEAVMTAIRLTRAYTKRNKIIKFAGCYHGHSDSVLSMSGSGLAALGLSTSPGVTKNTASETITLPYNDFNSLEITLSKYPKEIAGIIIEPIVGNAGVLLPKNNFLKLVREVSKKHKCLLIFDEVITGFRLSQGGAQFLFNITPDLTVLGKIIGGGMPIGAIGGKKEIMDLLAPIGPVYQAGTSSGNPISVSCGIATLKLLNEETYKYLEEITSMLCEGIKKINSEKNIKLQINSIGSMFTVFFTENEVYDYNSAKNSNTKRYADFFQKMLSKGIYLAPSQFEANFLSTAHKEDDIKKTLEAYKQISDNK